MSHNLALNWLYSLIVKVGKSQDLQDVTFVSDDGQKSSAHKVMLTELLFKIALSQQNRILYLLEGYAFPNIMFCLEGHALP